MKVEFSFFQRIRTLTNYRLGLLLIYIAALRIRLLCLPLERDEGEYAYIGRWILDGIPPYQEAYNMKLPGTYFMYTLIMGLFGKSDVGIHIGLLFVNLLTVVLLYFVSKKLFDKSIGFYSACIYGLLTLSSDFPGSSAHATQFVNLFIAIGLVFFTRFISSNKPIQIFFTGLMFGLGFIMKQHAVFFIVFDLLMLSALIIRRDGKTMKLANLSLLYLLGSVLPYLFILLTVSLTGNFEKFWFWTVEYARTYASGFYFNDARHAFNLAFKPMLVHYPIIWILAVAGFVYVLSPAFSFVQRFFVLTFGLFGFLTICPGFYFRPQYFITLLPAVAIFASIGARYFQDLVKSRFKLQPNWFFFGLFMSTILIATIAGDKTYAFNQSVQSISRSIYGSAPFVESPVIGKFINENTARDDKVAILGSEPQILFYADRRSATGYIYTYGLMENQPYNKQMQLEMIDQIEKNKPAILLYCKNYYSWAVRKDSPKIIFEWLQDYIPWNYRVAGITYRDKNGLPHYLWNEEVENFSNIEAKNYVVIYRRK